MPNTAFTRIYELALEDLTQNLLPWWAKYAVDEQNGGFYGEVRDDNTPVEGAKKFITLNTRLVWTFASAYRVLRNEEYRTLAKRAYDYLIEHFWDAEYEGFHSYVDAYGNVVDDHKFIYGNAFALYALSEYARAFDDSVALGYARRLRARLDAHVYDPVHHGYFEACRRDWTVDPWLHGVNRLPTDQKTMNTHLHMIEAYTCHLRVEDTGVVRAATREQLYRMLNVIVDRNTHHFNYFQDRAWVPTSSDISFGHDIEGSWLLMEAAEVLGEPEAHRAARDTCVNMARAVYDRGLTPYGSVYTEYSPVKRHYHPALSWWEQNEGVVGFLNAWEMTGEQKFLDASLRCMEFQLEHFVDHKLGGWFARTNLDGSRDRDGLKVAGPICPYHNGRMSMEVIERYRRHCEEK